MSAESLNLLSVSTVSLTTSAAKVAAPSDLPMDSQELVAVCQDSGANVAWQRSHTETGTYTPCLDTKESVSTRVSAGSTAFYAKVGSGTGTLYVEWWG